MESPADAPRPPSLDRASKLIVLLSTAAALGLFVYLVNRGFDWLMPLSIAAFIASCASALFFGDVLLAPIMLVAYLLPAIFLVLTNAGFSYGYLAPWLAAIFGAVAPRAVKTGWAFPRPLRAPLVLWMLGLALSWPIIVLRELDFTPSLLNNGEIHNSVLGIVPAQAITWILNVVCITSVALLWLDWLFANFPGERVKTFERFIVRPLFAGCLVAAGVAVYQAFGHIEFLNPTVFAGTGRTAGTMLDGNVFGVVAALWLPYAGALAFEGGRRRRMVATLWAMVFVGLGIAVWSTGSRTALLTATIGTTVLVGHSWRALAVRRMPVLVSVGGLVVAFAGLLVFTPMSIVGPAERLRFLLPDFSAASFRHALGELWQRNYYGAAATYMMAEHPWVGVGVGSFHVQVADIAALHGVQLPPDNAQNWYRHQFTEFGLLGSIGWMAWVVVFVWIVVRSRTPTDRPETTAAVKGALLGVSLASLLGMPTQDGTVAVTFVVLVFWLLQLTEFPRVNRPVNRGFSVREWSVVAVILALFLGSTADAAWTELRPPYRALDAQWNYRRGFYDRDRESSSFQWTGQHAVDVFPAEGRWIKLVIGAVAPDARDRPIPIKIWRDHDLIARFRRAGDASVTRYIQVPRGHQQVMIEIDVGRTWRPSDYGNSQDQRELGVQVENWSFVDSPPAGVPSIE